MSEVKQLTVKNIPVTIKQNTPLVEKREQQKKLEKAPAEKKQDVIQLSAKLHPEYDRDLKEAIQKVPKRERSKVVRDAVRMYLGCS